MELSRESTVPPGTVIARVGAESILCPNGARHPVVPAIEVIHAAGEYIKPFGTIRMRWQDDDESTEASKSPNAKVLGVVYGDLPVAAFTYRCSPSDRKMFDELYERWGLFHFIESENGKEPRSFTVFKTGFAFPGNVMSDLAKYATVWDAETMREALVDAYDSARATASDMTGTWGQTAADNKDIRDTIARIPEVLEEIGGGPLPWKPKEMNSWGKVDKEAHKWNVSQYLMVLENFQHSMDSSKLSESGQREMRRMVALLRRANIVEISTESYVELHMEVDRYTTEEICQLEFHHPESGTKPLQEEGQILIKRLTEATEQLPYPNKWPFDVCWFATGWAMMSTVQKAWRRLDPDEPAMLVGILASDTGEHHEVIMLGDFRGRQIRPKAYQLVTHRVKYDPDIEESGKWLQPMCLAPWILHRIVDCINDHKTVVMGKQHLSMASRRDIKRTQKKLKMRKPVPPPWYVVHLRDKVIHETEPRYRADQVTRKLSCRFTVRGHDCYKIYRGKLPMDPEFELKLENRGGYKFYKNRPLDEWAREVFRDRRLTPKLDDEWVAIKAWRREKFIKGPEDAPFVPSTRRATKGVLAWKKPKKNRS